MMPTQEQVIPGEGRTKGSTGRCRCHSDREYHENEPHGNSDRSQGHWRKSRRSSKSGNMMETQNKAGPGPLGIVISAVIGKCYDHFIKNMVGR